MLGLFLLGMLLGGIFTILIISIIFLLVLEEE